MNQADAIVNVWLESNDPKYPLDLRGLGLKRHPIIPSNVEILYLNGNEIEVLFLPDSIRVLDVSNNFIEIIHHLPTNLKEFYADNNIITSIAYFPKSLKYIKLCGNMLNVLPELPRMLKGLYVSNNKLKKSPIFPSSLRYIDISYNSITDCSALPKKLLYLWCHANNLKGIPDLPETLLGGTISHKNPLPIDEQQGSEFPQIRGKAIQEYRCKLETIKMKKCKHVSDLCREHIMKYCWNPETELGRYLVLHELND